VINVLTDRDKDILFNNKFINWSKFYGTTVAVTGSTGRLGMYIVFALLESNKKNKSNITIIAFARNKNKAEAIFSDYLNDPYLKFVIQDITNPIELDIPVDYFFHTAGLASPRDFTFAPVQTLWGHLKGTYEVLEFSKKHNVKRFFYVSTVEIYGHFLNSELITEESMGALECLSSRSCYPEAKRMCETMLASYKAEYGLDFVGVRLTHTLGPGISLEDGRAFAEFIKSTLKGEDIILHSDGSVMRTYTYTTDVIAAMFLVLLEGETKLYNVANDNNCISIRNLADKIAKLNTKKQIKVLFSDQTSSLKYLPFKLGTMDTKEIIRLGWEPKVSLDEALFLTFQYYNAKIHGNS